MTREGMPGRLLSALVGIVLAASSIAAALVLRDRSAPEAPTAPVASPAPPRGHRFPAPPAGAVVFARQLGSDALALGVVPRRRRLLLQASVLAPQGGGAAGLDLAFAVQGATRSASFCGAGCYRATVPTSGRPHAVEVRVRGAAPSSARWRVALPAAWPPRGAAALVARAARAWRSLHSLTFRETLASDSRHSLTSTWRVQAPDRLAYQVSHGTAGVVVGGRRWDRAAGATRWLESPQTPVTQPRPFWVAAVDAHVLGEGTVRGRPAWRISFFDPRTPAWFTVLVDRRNFRTLDLRMVTTAHFMHHVYGSFDRAAPIRPPR
ncbi:MAG: copper transport protein [Actinomycetota bacterium]|jgi:hypothetical protein